MRIAYADPPYPGCAHLYRDHPDYAGEVDHEGLVARLCDEYDGWILHTSSVALAHVLSCVEAAHATVRVMSWVKPFAAFKRNVSVAYAWEPVIVRAARKPVVKPGMTYRDWIAVPITLKRGLTGAKPEAVCRWLFEVAGCEPDDELDDLFPGTGAVTDAWEGWRSQMVLPMIRTSAGRVSRSEYNKAAREFENEILPLMPRAAASQKGVCIMCHDDGEPCSWCG